MVKTCTGCGLELPLTEFYWNKAPKSKHGGFYHSQCKTCHKARTKKYQAKAYQAKPADAKFLTYLARHHLTLERYLQVLLDQDGACKICLKVGKSRLHIDHDHGCCSGPLSCGKCVRGLLCGPCNRGLGMFKESPENLYRAAGYLADRA